MVAGVLRHFAMLDVSVFVSRSIAADDPTIRPAAHDLGMPLEGDDVTGVLADPLQVLWDTAGEDDIDADEAADALHRWLIERYRERHT